MPKIWEASDDGGNQVQINRDICASWQRDGEACNECLKLQCPAFIRTEQNTPKVDPDTCTGCDVCTQICPFDAFEVVEPRTSEPTMEYSN